MVLRIMPNRNLRPPVSQLGKDVSADGARIKHDACFHDGYEQGVREEPHEVERGLDVPVVVQRRGFREQIVADTYDVAIGRKRGNEHPNEWDDRHQGEQDKDDVECDFRHCVFHRQSFSEETRRLRKDSMPVIRNKMTDIALAVPKS